MVPTCKFKDMQMLLKICVRQHKLYTARKQDADVYHSLYLCTVCMTRGDAAVPNWQCTCSKVQANVNFSACFVHQTFLAISPLSKWFLNLFLFFFHTINQSLIRFKDQRYFKCYCRSHETFRSPELLCVLLYSWVTLVIKETRNNHRKHWIKLIRAM